MCRYGYGLNSKQKLVPVTHLDDEGNLVMKRTHESINNFHEVILPCVRSNHDVKIVLSGVHSRALAFYITTYSAKNQLSVQSRRDLLLACMRKNEARYNEIMSNATSDKDKEAHREKSRIMAIQCLNRFTSSVELGSPLVATHLLGLPNHYTSHDCVVVMWKSFVGFVEYAFGEANDTVNAFTFTFQADGTMTFVTQVMDYLCRPLLLKNVSPFCFYRDYSKVKGNPTAANRLLPFLPNHPQHGSHALAKNRYWKVPRLMGPQIPRRTKKKHGAIRQVGRLPVLPVAGGKRRRQRESN